MLLNNYNDSVVAVGALPCDPSALDDILTPNFSMLSWKEEGYGV